MNHGPDEKLYLNIYNHTKEILYNSLQSGALEGRNNRAK